MRFQFQQCLRLISLTFKSMGPSTLALTTISGEPIDDQFLEQLSGIERRQLPLSSTQRIYMQKVRI